MSNATGRPSKQRPLALERAEQLLSKKRWGTLRKLDLPADLDAVDRFLIGTHSELNGEEQAAALGVTHSLVHYWRGKLKARGLIDPAQRAACRPVLDGEAQAAARLYLAGYSKGAIAAMREISPHRVPWLLRRAGITPETPRQRPPLLTAPQLRELFSLGDDTAVTWRWTRYGWLPDCRVRARPGAPHGWSMDDVIALIRNRHSWPGWAPTQITDPQLRALAERERKAAGGAWFEQQEIARLLGLDTSSLRRWESEYGLWEGRERLPWAGSTLVWLTDQDQAAMAARAVPDGDRTSFARRQRASALKRWLIAAYGRPEMYQAAAD